MWYTRNMTTVPADNIDYSKKRVTLLKDARIDAISLVDRGANGQEFCLFKRAPKFVDSDGSLTIMEDNDERLAVEQYQPLIKEAPAPNGSWTTAYCVVAIPDEVDQQKDVWSIDEIRKAAHGFLRKNSPLINYMHSSMDRVGNVVESYIAPSDMKLGEQLIKAGSWVIGVEPFPEVKKMIDEGKVTGVSVQGTSKRENFDDTRSGEDDFLARMFSKSSDLAKDASSGENPGGYRSGMVVMRVIPLGAEGPGIEKLQELLGVTKTGIYDEPTEDAFVDHLEQLGVDTEPTIAILQRVLGGDLSAENAAQDGNVQAEGAPAQPQGAMPNANQQPEPSGQTDSTANGYDPAATATSFSGDTAGTEQIGTHYDSQGVNPAQANVGPHSTEEDLKMVLYQAAKHGNRTLLQHLKDVHGIIDPAQILHSKFDPQMLQFMVSAFVLGRNSSGPASDKVPPKDPNAVTNQPSHTPKESMPAGSGYSMQKAAAEGMKKTRLKTYNDKNQKGYSDLFGKYTNVAKGGMFDFKTPDTMIYDKKGNPVRPGEIVRLGDGRVVEVSSIDWQNQKLRVVYNNKKGTEVLQEVGPEQVEAVTISILSKANTTVDKNGVNISVGAIVMLNDTDAAEVTEVDGDKVTVVTADEGNNEVSRTVDASQVEVKVPLAKGVAPASSGGSMGGHDPKAAGKIRFIVRSFGKWAGGKHRICVARMKSEHPEVFKGNEDAGCAWLKDQYLHTTHWRNRKGLAKGTSAFANLYNASVVTDNSELNNEQIHNIFIVACTDMGLDPEEMNNMMDSNNYDEQLDNLFGADEAGDGMEETPEANGFLTKVASIFKSQKSPTEKAQEAEELFKSVNDLADPATRQKRLESALTAVRLGIEDAAATGDAIALEDVIMDFNEWTNDYVASAELMPEAVEKAGKMCAMHKEMGMENPDPNCPDCAKGDTETPEEDMSEKAEEPTKVPFGGKKAAPFAKNVSLNKTKGIAVSEDLTKSAFAPENMERIAEMRDFLNDMLAVDDTAGDTSEGYNAEIEKEATQEETMSDTEGANLNDIIEFCNDLADRLETYDSKFSEFDGLGSKIEKVGELAKSLDITDRLDALEAQLTEIRDGLAPAAEVEAVSKRLQAIENQPGQSTAVSEDTAQVEVVAKSATAPMFTRGGHSLF
jgi:hypothetical protein